DPGGPIEVLLEEEASEQRGRHRLEVEPQRDRGRGGERQTGEQQHGTEDASESDRAGETSEVLAIDTANSGETAERPRSNGDRGTKIENTRQEQRAEPAQERLGCGRGRAEQRRRQ